MPSFLKFTTALIVPPYSGAVTISPVDRVEHHLLFGGGRLLAFGGGERNGSHQRERQCH